MIISSIYKNIIIKLRDLKFVDTPEIDARLIICGVLNITLNQFILYKDEKTVLPDEYKNILKYVERRVNGESIASILGVKEFFGREFVVDENVLIPRPETELLIEKVIEIVKPDKKYDILDIGTGSGAISITLLKELDNICVDALDVSEKALDIARKNASHNGVGLLKIKFLLQDFLSFSTNKKYDFIISNPPYIPTDVTNKIIYDKQVSDPVISLDGGQDGLDFYRKIKEFSTTNIKKDGYIIFEHGFDQRDVLKSMFVSEFDLIDEITDYGGNDRILLFKHKS